MATTYNAGVVTAYGAAVRGGYTGTYEQYCEEQAHIGTNAQRAEAAADRAEAAAETLSGSVAQIATNTQDITALKEDYDDIDDRVTALEGGGSGSGLTDAMKQALLQIASKVAYIDDQGQTYYDALEEALYPPADLVSISCVYTQSGTVYNSDSLNDLKDDLVVTANYDNGTHQTVTDYNLSGTLTVGTSTISVIWGGMTTTFDVIVSRYDNSVYSWDFTQGITDSKQGVVADIGSGVTQDASGLTFDGSANAYAKLINLSSYSSGYTVEVDVKTITQASGTGPYSIIGMGTSGDGYSPSCGLRINADGNWRFRDTSNNWKKPTPTINGFEYFDNATLKWQVDYSGKKWSLYKNDVLVTENTSTYQSANGRTILGLDTASVDGLGNGTIIKAVRVYAGVV